MKDLLLIISLSLTVAVAGMLKKGDNQLETKPVLNQKYLSYNK